ncbi:MAG: phosphoenolpyruvate synthase [Microgenomates group bacterium]
MTAQKKDKNILWFEEIDKDDISLVGGKGANLGEMASFGIPVPPGFVVTAKAYFDFLEKNKLTFKIKNFLSLTHPKKPETYLEASEKIKKLILAQEFPQDLGKEIIESYLKLGGVLSQAEVAIRSSATAEDLPTASFAGQQKTFLNIKGEANVVEKVKECWASLFEPRAIFYREEKGFDHFRVGIAVVIQKMIPSEVSGIMFTCDPVTNQKNRIIIEAIWGLGEYVVGGKVTPDIYWLDKSNLNIIKKEINPQKIQLLPSKRGKTPNQEKPVPLQLQNKRKLTDKQIIELAQIGKKIHRHYFYPQDIEWALYKGKFYILQTRPVTTVNFKEKKTIKAKKIKEKPILVGQPASPGIGSGPVIVINSIKEINKVKQGDILVTPMTNPDFVPVMKKVAGIVTDKGGQTSHAAIVSRELGVPCVVGTKNATKILKNGEIITINGTTGEIYKGNPFAKKQTSLVFSPLKKEENIALSTLKTATKIYVNLAEPELAEEIAQRNVDGVGLLRAEFMMAQIGIHPKKIIKDKKQKFFIEKLANNLTSFCKAFYPRPVVYRTTDFKTNEYRNLIGGKAFEPEEENPLLGFRGAFRYITNPEILELELKAIKEVRKNYNNLWLMIPFCRTPQELQEVKKIIVGEGLIRGPSFKLWLMVEIPANVILLEEFAKVGIDGVSIGSNDLTMLILGVDRDNQNLAPYYPEENPAVLWAIEKTIKTCQKLKITSSICGQAPSVYPRLIDKLVDWGITSISVNPDAIETTRQLVYEAEKRKVKWRK